MSRIDGDARNTARRGNDHEGEEMPKDYLQVKVELVAGLREGALWPRGGRSFVVASSTTFKDFSAAIHTGFGRWGSAAQHHFVLGDGTWLKSHGVTDVAEGVRATTSSLDDASTPLSIVAPGDRFIYEYDELNRWQHVCTVSELPVDVIKELGFEPDGPIVTAGWGPIPDQNGREWEEFQFEGAAPPQAPDPALSDFPEFDFSWIPPTDMREPRDHFNMKGIELVESEDVPKGATLGYWHDRAIEALDSALKRRDYDALFVLLKSFDPLMVAHRSASALEQLTRVQIPELRMILEDIVEGLEARGWDGDRQLAVLLRAGLDGKMPEGGLRRVVNIEMKMLTAILAGPADAERNWTLDIANGELIAPEARTGDGGDAAGGAAGRGTDANRIEVGGLGSETQEEDIRVVKEHLGFTLEEDVTADSGLLLAERSFGRARAWLDEAGLRPA